MSVPSESHSATLPATEPTGSVSITASLDDERQTWAQARALIRSDLDRQAAHLKQTSFAHRAYFFCLPGFQALFWYRLSRYLYLRNWRNAARLISLFSLYLTRAELPPTTSIGPSALIAHGTCVNAFGRIGARVTMNGSCGFGGGFGVKDIGGGPGYPIVGDDVVLAYGAQVMGSVRIGHGAHIGPGALVTFDVADGALVLWDRPRVIAGGANRGASRGT